jgi:hypothetical protein
MDPAVLGGLITGLVGLLGMIISRTRCFMRVLPTGEGEDRVYAWQAGCGFTEAQILPSDSRIEHHKIEENEIIFMKPQ